MKALKKDFPIFTNNPNLVYLDSAATSQKPQSVIYAVTEFYTQYNSNIHRGIYPIAEKATAKVEEVRKKVAKFIGAKDPLEIVFTKGTTEAINLVMYSWGKDNVKKDDIVMTTAMEHHANFVPWQILAAENDALFAVVDITEYGHIEREKLLQDVESVKLLAISYVSNMLGTIFDLTSLISDIRKINKDIIILVDAAQAVPHMTVDVQKLDCDFFVFSGHKMLGGTGVGVLYAKRKLLESMRPFLFGGDMIREVSVHQTSFADLPNKFEGGTINIGGIVSLGAAVNYLENVGMDRIREHEKELLDYCLDRIEKIDGLVIYGPKKIKERSGLISFNINGIHPHDLAQVLADENICVRAGHHYTMPLHTRLGIPASVRASFYIYNDEKDVDALIAGIRKAQKIFQ